MILKINGVEIGDIKEYNIEDNVLAVKIEKVDPENIKRGCVPGLGGR